MIGNYRDIFVAIITIIALVLPLLTYLTGANTVKATASSESQTRSTISAVLPLVQNGGTQNHFTIDKSQFKKAPEFVGITGYIIHLFLLN